jgi:hypothetical protein
VKKHHFALKLEKNMFLDIFENANFLSEF